MDRRRERADHVAQEEPVTWESNSSDEDSSGADRDGVDLLMHQPEIDVEDDLAYEFPRDELAILLEGLNKWPWTVYPSHLTSCLLSASKIASLGLEEASTETRRLQILYREVVPSSFEKCLDDKAIWKWNDEIHNNIFDALCRLVDLVVAKLPQLQRENSSASANDLIHLLRSLSLGFDKQSQYHMKHKDQPRPAGSASQVAKFAKAIPGSPVKQKNGDWYCAFRKASVKDVEGCTCSKCKPPDMYCWLAYLLNYFGQTPYGNGYHRLIRVLSHPHKLLPAILESGLLLVTKASEFLTNEVAEAFLEPCTRILKYVADQLEKDVDALSDKTRDGSFGALSMILRHSQTIFARSWSSDKAERMVSVVQRRMVERMLGFQSFNKHLTAVREINKLLENARAITSMDNGLSVSITIQWLQENDILQQVLRSHLHHKQYVDQVQKIMRFLLQEKFLSEEHLDTIWAATDKPDQFEVVKTNIFDLISDLAWSFSSDQLDSLFRRLEHIQGRSVSDVVKILCLVKKLSRSDNEGVMASRLLELLWNMTLSSEAPAEILDSGALTEILSHYDSVNCASKDAYISRCVANIKEEKLVVPSLKLLRDFILLDCENSSYEDEASRQRIQQLIREHDLLHMIVISLEKYMVVARTSCCSSIADDLACHSVSCSHIDSRFTHEEHVKERLEFLLSALQCAGQSLSCEDAGQLWTTMIESPAFNRDREKAFDWYCEALDKWLALSLEAQRYILMKKITNLDPASLSQSAWRCFMRLFTRVNQSDKKLHLQNEDSTVTQDMDLVGLAYLWRIAFLSSNECVAEQSINLLKDIYTSISESLQHDLTSIRKSFIDLCVGHLSNAVERVSKYNMEMFESSNTTSYGSDEKRTGALEEDDQGLLKLEDLNKNLEMRFQSGDGNEPDVPPVDGVYQVERCLKILRIFIVNCEGRCRRTVPAHTATFQGRPFLLGINTANKQFARFEVMVHANEYLSSLRAKVAKVLEHPASRIRLTYLNRELTQDSQVLWQCGLVGGHNISASVSMVDCCIKPCDEAQQLPGILMSKNIKIYDILFKLANANDNNLQEEAYTLLALLPTYPAILADFQNMHTRSLEESRQLLVSHFGVQSRLLYMLQVLDGLIIPANRPADSYTFKFQKSFLESGGIRYLLAVLEPGALPEQVDKKTQRGCYASSLRLLKFLLLEKGSQECVGKDPKDSKGAMRVDVSTRMLEIQAAAQEVRIVQSDSHETDVNMELVVVALKRLAWAAALGQLSAMSTPSPAACVLGKTGGRTAKKRSFPDDDISGLDQEDQYLCLEAFDFLVLCLLRDEYLLGSFFSTPDTESFIVGMLLHSPDEIVRYRAALAFLKLGTLQGDNVSIYGVVHRHILLALISSKTECSQHSKRCLHFWELLGQLFCNIEDVEEQEIAEQQLDDEVQWLQSAAAIAIEDDDRLLEGHLHLVRVLIEVLDKRIIGTSKTTQCQSLVELLIKKFLFPESEVLCNFAGKIVSKVISHGIGYGILGTPLAEDNGPFQAMCGTRGSREKAFQLLVCLATHCVENLKEILDLLKRIHFSEQILDWEHLPSYGRKAMGGYVGLKNAGATCYMNSVFQQLFMQPEVRKTVLSCSECDDLEKPGSVFFQLQAMFGALLGSSLDHYTPQGFWCAYRDYDGMPVNLREHQDAFEFFNRLYDAIDETLKATRQETTLTRIFGGIFSQQIIGRGCPHRSEREEPFAAISVDVKNKKDLIESLEAFVQGDLLEGDNAYYCDICGTKVDALKRVCVKSLPHTLVIHLKRFDFDYETMQRLKLKDRFEFPIHLDMKPFTVEGLALHESSCLGTCSPTKLDNVSQEMNIKDYEAQKNKPTLLKPDSYYHYELVGVVVHSGTAFAGHYYSYIKQRAGDQTFYYGSSPNGRWISFDDKRVEPYDVKDLERDCYGGKYTVDVYDNFLKTSCPQEFDRPNSAYMLLYERSDEVTATSSPLQVSTLISKEDEDGDLLMEGQRYECLSNLSKELNVPVSIHQSVCEENLRFVHENHLLDKDYFRFLLSLVDVNCDLVNARSLQKYHVDSVPGAMGKREGYGVLAEVNCMSGVVESGDETDCHMDAIARECVTLATMFLFRVYLRTHASFREDISHWKLLLRRLLEHNASACKTFIQLIIEQPHWIHEYLVKCPVEEVQQACSDLLVQAMRCTVRNITGNSYTDGAEQSDALQLNTLVDTLISVLRDPTLPKFSCHNYFQVILEYANFGSSQRFHLLKKSIVSQLVYTTVNFATKVDNLHLVKLDLLCLHSIVSLLLRSCDITKLYNISECDPGKMAPDNEDYAVTTEYLSMPNPLQLPPPLIPVPSDAVDTVFKQRMYITILIESCPEDEEVVKLIKYCSWQNEAFTLWVLQDVLELLQRSANTDVRALIAFMLSIASLEDPLQSLRQEILLFGYDNLPHGVMDYIMTRVMNTQKRYGLLKFIVKFFNAYPATHRQLVGRKADWKRVVDWLQEELQGHYTSNALNGPFSNEDATSGPLRRTNSAEWTLANARNLFGS